MAELLRNWRVLLWLIFIMLALGIVFGRGIQFGIDFKGGTLFQIELGDPVKNLDERASIVRTVQQRLDWTGLRDISVSFFGDNFVIAQVAETDPETIERIESLLRKQGVFEATIDGNVIFTGEEIRDRPKDPAMGYGLYKEGGRIRWSLPFVLKSTAANRFKQLTFHRCELVSYTPETGKQYECDNTYFFIDRPKKAVIVVSADVYENDKRLLLQGIPEEGIGEGTKLDEILLNAAAPHFVVKEKQFTGEQAAELQAMAAEKETAIVPEQLSPEMQQSLTEMGFLTRIVEVEGGKPFITEAVGLRSIIALSEGVAQMDVATLEQAKAMNKLQIFGYASTIEAAEQRRNDLEILLQSGSLSVSVRSISKETISPLLGENFLQSAAMIGLVALAIVAIVLFLRYRVLKLTLPIAFIGLSEVLITAALASLISKFDLGAVAGILAAVGTGVDHQIVITDELKRGEAVESGSQLTRMKRAFFIIMVSALTTIATMTPIIIIGFGMGRLVGFAITTTIGVLVGILITRPAFGEIAKVVLGRQ